MGGKCSPSGGISPVKGRSLPIVGKPNSRSDLHDESGELVQSRWYDLNGFAMWDRDYKHQDAHNNHEFPHDHKWEWKWNAKKGKHILVRSEALPVNSEEFC